MAPTTLVTFRVRAPPATRTLDLYGSWDNFTTSYRMSKDLQAGSDYWSGCFNFTNIICDGAPGDAMRSRDGGLKMGGTYWYHYKIDDVTDFHNICERATTNCPLMPGQLVNVLNVPYAFSGQRSRHPSSDSASCEHRTMDPQDRFMNPRPAPAKPKILRLNTSPVETTFQNTSGATPIKEAPVATKLLRVAKKASLDSSTTSAGGALAGGLRAAFKIRTARSQSPGDRRSSRELHHTRAASTGQTLAPQNGIEDNFLTAPQRGLLLRSASDEAVPNLSFRQHRQQMSRSGGRGSDRNNSPPRQIVPLALLKSNHGTLTPLDEVSSKAGTPDDEVSSGLVPDNSEPDLEKRLPTLPNTPSSAYPASIVEASPPKRQETPAEQQNSHFSTTTIDTDANPISMAFIDQSHFSAWTMTTHSSSIFCENSIPLPTVPIRLPTETANAKVDLFPSSAASLTSASSSVSTTPSTCFQDIEIECDVAPNLAVRGRETRLPFQTPHYSLPEVDCTSQATLKMPPQEQLAWQGNPQTCAKSPENASQAEIMHSESMRRLLEELSYLSESISLH